MNAIGAQLDAQRNSFLYIQAISYKLIRVKPSFGFYRLLLPPVQLFPEIYISSFDVLKKFSELSSSMKLLNLPF